MRLTPTVVYAGPGGDAELLGLYFADTGQHLEHRLLVDHAVPNCRSRVTYKGALQGQAAHTVWVGDVVIRAEATGTDTYELNRNLLLTDGARADSVPNLEIETGEVVGAGHASARPAGSTSSSCSTCRPAASRPTWPVGSSSAASSPRSSRRSPSPSSSSGCWPASTPSWSATCA